MRNQELSDIWLEQARVWEETRESFAITPEEKLFCTEQATHCYERAADFADEDEGHDNLLRVGAPRPMLYVVKA